MTEVKKDEFYTADMVDENGEKIEPVKKGCCQTINMRPASCCSVQRPKTKKPENKGCGCKH